MSDGAFGAIIQYMNEQPNRILIEIRGPMPQGDCVAFFDFRERTWRYLTIDALLQPAREENARLLKKLEKAEETIRTLSESVKTFGEALKEHIE